MQWEGAAVANENLASQIGELRGTVTGLQDSFNKWMEHWVRQDEAATSSRKALYERVEGLSSEVAGQTVTLSTLKEDVENLKDEIDTRIMPTITAYNLANAHRAGMWLMGKLFWAAVLAICTVLGFAVHEGLRYFPGVTLPIPHL